MVMVTTPDGDLLAFPVEDGQLSTGDDFKAFVTERLANVLPGLVGDLKRKLVKTGAKPSPGSFVDVFGAVLEADADAFDEPGVLLLALKGTATVTGGQATFSDVTLVEDPQELAEFDLSELLDQNPKWAELKDKLVAREAAQKERAVHAAVDVAGAAPKRRVSTPVVDMNRGMGKSVTGH